MAVATLTELQSRIIDSQAIQKGVYQFGSQTYKYNFFFYTCFEYIFLVVLPTLSSQRGSL